MNNLIRTDKKRIAGIGAALVDLLVYESDAYLNGLSDIKGGMTLVDNAFIEDALKQANDKPSIVPGGAACNTIVGLGTLGADVLFLGKCGQDAFGALFRQGLEAGNVTPCLIDSSSPTGKVLSVITPDSQRSMFTFLGASAELHPEDIDSDTFADAAIVLIEGYLLFNRDLMKKALQAARQANALVAMDLASFTVVEASMDFLVSDVIPMVDILIANEDEARAYTGHDDEQKALEALSRDVSVAVLKVGRRGSYIADGKKVYKIQAFDEKEALDTTGAGDLWASGFFYGLINGYPMEACGKIASACGYEVCQVTGATIPDDGWKRIEKLIDTLTD